MAALQQPARRLLTVLSSRPATGSAASLPRTAPATRRSVSGSSAASSRPTPTPSSAAAAARIRSSSSSSSRPTRLPSAPSNSSSSSRRAYSALNVAGADGPSASSSAAFGPGPSSSSLNAATAQSSRSSLASSSGSSSSSSSGALERPVVVCPDKAAVRAQAEEDGLDEPEWVAEDEAYMLVTPAAWKQLAKIGKRERAMTDGTALGCLRVAVDSGGCHGYQDKLELVQRPEIDDYIMSAPPSTLTSLSLDSSSVPLPVVVDPASLAMLKGATLDFTTELIGSAFRVRENPQAKGAGCGCGVSWEAK